MARQLKVMAAILGIAAILMSEQSLFYAAAANDVNGNETAVVDETDGNVTPDVNGAGENNDATTDEEGGKEAADADKADENGDAAASETGKNEDAATDETENTEQANTDETENKEQAGTDETNAEDEESDTESGEDGNTEPVYNAPINLEWSTESPGLGSFECHNTEEVFYRAELYRDGNIVPACNTIIYANSGFFTMPFFLSIRESGSYTFKVGVSKDSPYDEVTYWSEESAVYNYTRPAALSAPTNIKWSETNAGTVTWNPVEHADCYLVNMYIDNRSIYSDFLAENAVDFSPFIGEGTVIEVTVRAFSENIELYAHSEESERVVLNSEAITIKDTVNDKIDGAIDDATSNGTTNIVNAVSNIKAAFSDSSNKSALQVAMQSDAATAEKIADIEDKYGFSANITMNKTVADDTGLDGSKVSILGAALNASENATVSFNVSLPEEGKGAPIDTNVYKSVVQFSMNLEGDGINSSDLAIPVTITMPVPDNMEVNNLIILHYHQDGSYETIRPRKNNDGTVSFTITRFSIFAFAEKRQASSSPSSPSDSGSTGNSYVVGSSNNTGSYTVSTYEPYVPKTADEKKRYSYFSREKVSYTPAADNSYMVIVANSLQGKQCFDSFEAVLGDYTIGRTYSIFPHLRPMAYNMADEVTITLAIPKALQKEGRVYQMICVTENGMPIVLNDLDSQNDTITFKTNKFHAFALVYKDTK